jgi:hypothetical protein
MPTGLLVFGAILALVFAFVTIYNKLVDAADKATGAWNDLDALLRQRHDEIPQLIELCERHLPKDRAAIERFLEARAAVFAGRQTRDADALGHAEIALQIQRRRPPLQRGDRPRAGQRRRARRRVPAAAAARLRAGRLLSRVPPWRAGAQPQRAE